MFPNVSLINHIKISEYLKFDIINIKLNNGK